LIAERVARRLADESGVPQSSHPQANGRDAIAERPRARLINFVSTAPPARTQPSISLPAGRQPKIEPTATSVPQVAQSPWLAPFTRNAAQSTPQIAEHPSQEKFGVEEAVVSELVEFFENEKQCSVDPSGKPCDHCAMCNSRGF
jgi:hypothetical protein